MQINNLKIKYSKIYQKWQIITPSKIILDEFECLLNAVDSAKNIKDFISRGR